MTIKTYGSISKLRKLFKGMEKVMKSKEEYIPLNMTLVLAMDLKRQGLTK